MTADAALLSIFAAALGGALGAAAGWLARGRWPGLAGGSVGTEPTTTFVVEIITRFPSMMIQGPIIGWGMEVQGITASSFAAPPSDGADPTTGLSFGPPESEQ